MAESENTGNVSKAPDNTERKKELETGESRSVLWHDRKHHLWFPCSFTKYTVKNGRIYVERGFLNSVSDQTLLYRITDIRMKRSLGQKIFGTGTIVLVSKVDADHEVVLENIKNPAQVYEQLSDLIEEARHKKNVVGNEFYSKGCGTEGFDHDDFDGPDDD